MNKLFALIAVCFCFLSKAQTGRPASLGHEIYITSNYKDTQVYVGTYYGKIRSIIDSAKSDATGLSVFSGPDKWTKGIYFFVTPQKSLEFEFLVDDAQHFSIAFNNEHPGKLIIKNSEDNSDFAAYTDFLTTVSPQLNALQSKLSVAKSKADSVAIRKEIKEKAGLLSDYRNQLITSKPESLLARFLQVAKIPDTPAIPVSADGTADSSYPYRFVKEHFWDQVDFYEDYLLRTPFFEPKFEDYFKYYVSPNPDSIINEVDYMLYSARAGNDIFTYLLGKFTDQYINPKIMGQDKVFLHLFQNYYLQGDTNWLNEKQKKYIFDRGYSLFANQLNDPAPQLELTDTSGKAVSLYNLKAPYTFIAFWDPHCGHCKEKIPLVDSIYKAKWKALGIKILGVCVQEYLIDDWKKFIVEKNLEGWTHAYQTKEAKTKVEMNNQPSYHQLYDIQQTPTFYLLDEQKHIIAKGLTLEQYDNIISAKSNQTKLSNQ